MDVGMVYNLIALSVSTAALAVSTLLAVRQMQTARSSCQDSNITLALTSLNAEYRSKSFRRSEYFVLNRLSNGYDPGAGVSGLPEDVQEHVIRVGHFYGDYGMLAILPTYDRNRIIGVIHGRV